MVDNCKTNHFLEAIGYAFFDGIVATTFIPYTSSSASVLDSYVYSSQKKPIKMRGYGNIVLYPQRHHFI